MELFPVDLGLLGSSFFGDCGMPGAAVGSMLNIAHFSINSGLIRGGVVARRVRNCQEIVRPSRKTSRAETAKPFPQMPNSGRYTQPMHHKTRRIPFAAEQHHGRTACNTCVREDNNESATQ